MTVSTKSKAHPCGCLRATSDIVLRETSASGVGVPIRIRSESQGVHDPRWAHVLRVPVRRWASDTWPGKP